MQEIAHDMEIEKFYMDTAKSGRFTENRPEYNRMKEEIQNGTIQAKTIVVRALDRLHRNVAHQKYMGTYVYDRTESKDSEGRRNSHKEKAQYLSLIHI